MKPRVVILGAAGQLGVELVKLLQSQANLFAFSRRELDLTDDGALRAAILPLEPHFIVNAAAYTAVDRAESEAVLAQAVNARAPQSLAELSLRLNAWLLHFSTDYVFDGSAQTPWKETDAPHPLNVYGRTKLEGEKAIAASGCRHLIFRTSWVYASRGSNFLRTMLRLGAERPKLSIVGDQIGAPTTAGELARAVSSILNKLDEESAAHKLAESGIYHMTCSGSTTWFDFARAIFASFNGRVSTPELLPISTEQYPTPAVRPRYSVLNCDKLEKSFGIRLAPWEDGLAKVIAEIQTEGI
ncbi:MAG: dTDP-4-dehydrorhamnose reductase [Terracidiphilus sp.]